MKPCLLVVVGPTAAGKTDLCVQLAKSWQIPVLSADSRQFYKEMSIGTAKPSVAEMQGVPHYFVDSLSIEANYSAGHFERDALALLAQLFQKKPLAIMVGGSGLFIQAVCEGMDVIPELPAGMREQLMHEFAQHGLAPLLQELHEKDPDYFNQVDRANHARVIRAIEVIRTTQKPFSQLRQRQAAPRDFDIIKIGVTKPREILYARINARVEAMMEAGLLDEVKGLFPQKNLNALQTVGYQELFEYLENKCTLEEAIELLKRNTRRYAKKQMTWFNRDTSIAAWFDPAETEKIKCFAEEAFKEKGLFLP